MTKVDLLGERVAPAEHMRIAAQLRKLEHFRERDLNIGEEATGSDSIGPYCLILQRGLEDLDLTFKDVTEYDVRQRRLQPGLWKRRGWLFVDGAGFWGPRRKILGKNQSGLQVVEQPTEDEQIDSKCAVGQRRVLFREGPQPAQQVRIATQL